jgi:coniferyl-aldehyde dehydrogenase
VDDARSKGARVLPAASPSEALTTPSGPFPPTLIVAANDSMRVMQAEIFGPILPVVTYSSFDEALSYINARPRPLALYYFDSNKSRIGTVLDRTTAGGVCINDCIFHFAQHRLPFGGIGPSGIGAYHGHEGFKTFSKKKGVLLQSTIVGSVIDRFLKPPYTPATNRAIRLLSGRTTTRPFKRIRLPE